MKIDKIEEGGKLTIKVEGRVDTTTSPELDGVLGQAKGGETLVLDLAGVPYMSSAGLRCLLTAQKRMTKGGGSLTLVGVQPVVREVLDITGFSDILTIS